MRKRAVLFSVLILCLVGEPVMAWNAAGHMTVALMAYRRLTVDERATVAAILREHPHYELYLSKGAPDGVSIDEWAFVRAATWPDFVRPARDEDREFKDRTITQYHHANWHRITIPYVTGAAATQPTTRPLVRPDDEDGDDALKAFEILTAQLRKADTPKADRAIALAWIQHIIGDLHQPLHAASLFSDEYPNSDRGGNEQAVRVEGKPITLHSLWDGLLGSGTGYDAVAFLADDIAADPRCTVTKQRGYAENKTLKSWAEESNRMAIAFVYLNGRLRTAPIARVRDKTTAAEDVPPLPVSYLPNARDAARVRTALAAERLANTISASLAAK